MSVLRAFSVNTTTSDFLLSRTDRGYRMIYRSLTRTAYIVNRATFMKSPLARTFLTISMMMVITSLTGYPGWVPDTMNMERTENTQPAITWFSSMLVITVKGSPNTRKEHLGLFIVQPHVQNCIFETQRYY